MSPAHSIDHNAAQGGFVLVTSLVFLLVITLLALAGVRAAAQLSQMATTDRARNQAVEIADSALRFAEMRLASDAFCITSAQCPTDQPFVTVAEGAYPATGNSSDPLQAHYRIDLIGRAYTWDGIESGKVDLLFRITSVVHSALPGERSTVQSINRRPGRCSPENPDTHTPGDTELPPEQRMIERLPLNPDANCRLLPSASDEDALPYRYKGHGSRLSWHEIQV